MLSIYKISRPVKIHVHITIVQFPLQFFVFMHATLTSVFNFQFQLKALSTVHGTCSNDQPQDGPIIGPKHVAGIIYLI